MKQSFFISTIIPTITAVVFLFVSSCDSTTIPFSNLETHAVSHSFNTLAATETDPNTGNSIDPASENAWANNWQSSVNLIDIPYSEWTGEDFGSPTLRDIMTHSTRKNLDNDPVTNAHETQHFLNNEVRTRTNAFDNAIYFGNGKAALIAEPSTPPKAVQESVPSELKSGNLYQHYLVKQVENFWKSELLYIFDEWSGYRTGSKVANELIKSGNQSVLKNRICIHDGTSEFLIFGTSAVLTLYLKEPKYLNTNEFRAMYASLAEETVTSIKIGAGKQLTDCNASKNLQYFKTAPAMQKHREVLRGWLGNRWVTKVFGTLD
jgi:hypothetical protein